MYLESHLDYHVLNLLEQIFQGTIGCKPNFPIRDVLVCIQEC